MDENKANNIVAKTFLEIAESLETGNIPEKFVIGIASEGSESNPKSIDSAIALAEKKGYKTLLIKGREIHNNMEKMIESGEIDGAITMHYSFPIGISTVGKLITPAKGKEMYIATTTGMSDTERVSALIKNTINGIIVAKASGIENPTLGIANIDGAKKCERELLKLRENGYPLNFASSSRAEGGRIMRGNDLLMGTPDIMIMDSLTGNLMMKIFSAFTTGGSVESLGWGYGPGIGEKQKNLIMIVSRASGPPVIVGAIEFANTLLKNKVWEIADREYKAVNKAGLQNILKNLKTNAVLVNKQENIEIEEPEKEIVTSEITGIDVMELENAVRLLWKEKIYAISGMGCTGPVVLVSDDNLKKSEAILGTEGYIDLD